MALESPAYVISADSHSAALFRQAAATMVRGTGIVQTGALQVTQNGTPNMSVNVAAGYVWIPGTLGSTSGMGSNITAQTAYGLASTQTAQGNYAAYNDGTVNLAISAADPTNPRIDLVVASVQDAQYSGSNNQPVLQVITGTAAPSPSAPSAPASSVVLAQVAVAAGASSIVTANITDTRPALQLNGAVARVTGSSQYPLNPAAGDYIDDSSLNALLRWSGSAWVPVGFGAWTAYTPAVTASTTNPTQGNSTYTGKYVQVGKTVHFTVIIDVGSTFVAGSGVYQFSLPPGLNLTTTELAGPAMVYNSGGWRPCMWTGASASTITLFRCSNESSVGSAGLAAAWASGNVISIYGTYQAA